MSPRTIPVQFPRSLELSDVLEVQLASLEPEEVQRAGLQLARAIGESGTTPVGPLVQYVRAENGTHNISLLRQRVRTSGKAHRDDMPVNIDVSGCVLARFRGDPADLDVAYSKLAVYAYENELRLTGSFIVVFVSQERDDAVIDVFAECFTGDMG